MNTSLSRGNNTLDLDKFVQIKQLADELGCGKTKMWSIIKEYFPKRKPYARLTPAEAKKIVQHLRG